MKKLIFIPIISFCTFTFGAFGQNGKPMPEFRPTKLFVQPYTKQVSYLPLNITVYNNSSKLVNIFTGSGMLCCESEDEFRRFSRTNNSSLLDNQVINSGDSFQFQFFADKYFTGSVLGAAIVNIWTNDGGWTERSPNCQMWIPSNIRGRSGVGSTYAPYLNESSTIIKSSSPANPGTSTSIGCTIVHTDFDKMQIDIFDMVYPVVRVR